MLWGGQGKCCLTTSYMWLEGCVLFNAMKNMPCYMVCIPPCMPSQDVCSPLLCVFWFVCVGMPWCWVHNGKPSTLVISFGGNGKSSHEGFCLHGRWCPHHVVKPKKCHGPCILVYVCYIASCYLQTMHIMSFMWWQWDFRPWRLFWHVHIIFKPKACQHIPW